MNVFVLGDNGILLTPEQGGKRLMGIGRGPGLPAAEGVAAPRL